MNNKNFRAERISKTSTIILNDNIEFIFPLFGAFEERKWAENWNPELIYPEREIIQEGTTFKTKGHGHDEAEFIWIVSKYEMDKFLIQYLVTTINRYWTITIKCDPMSDNTTSCDITYTFLGLNGIGNKLNEYSLHKMFKQNLKNWEEDINNYLKNIS